MKKHWRSIAICAAACMLAAGCGEKEPDAGALTPTAAPTEELEAEPTKAEIKEEPSPTPEADPTEADPVINTLDRKECYEEILGYLKAVMDGQCTRKEMEGAGIYSSIWEYGWKETEGEGSTRYLYYDVDGDGTDELVITYRDIITDIYGFDGRHAQKTLWPSADSTLNIHPDGMLQMSYASSNGDSGEMWFQFDTILGDYFAVFERRNEAQFGDQYYTFCYYGLEGEEYEEVLRVYRESGYYPVWIGEWADQLTKEEYEKIVPKTVPVKLPEGQDFSGVHIPEGIVSAKPADEAPERVRKCELGSSVQYESNIFLSNFTEQHRNANETYSFSVESDVYDLVYFAFKHIEINSYKDLVYNGTDYTLTLDQVNKVLERYLGKRLSEEEAATFYNDSYATTEYFFEGKFHLIAAAGEGSISFAVVKEMYELSDGTTEMIFDVYGPTADEGLSADEMQKLYKLSAAEAEKRNGLACLTSGRAIVTPYPYSGRDSYRLVSLEVGTK